MDFYCGVDLVGLQEKDLMWSEYWLVTYTSRMVHRAIDV